jgi:hypothetical protein
MSYFGKEETESPTGYMAGHLSSGSRGPTPVSSTLSRDLNHWDEARFAKQDKR